MREENKPQLFSYADDLSASDKRHIDKAVKAARASQHHRHRVGATLVVAARITSASNRLRNERSAPFTEQSVHAEVRAVLRAYKNGRGGTIYVARVGSRDRLLPSHPCVRCTAVLKEACVRRIVWWNGDSWVAVRL